MCEQANCVRLHCRDAVDMNMDIQTANENEWIGMEWNDGATVQPVVIKLPTPFDTHIILIQIDDDDDDDGLYLHLMHNSIDYCFDSNDPNCQCTKSISIHFNSLI